MAHDLLLQGNCPQLPQTTRHTVHLEHRFKNILVNLNDRSEGERHTVHTALEKQGQEIASKATATPFTHVSFNGP